MYENKENLLTCVYVSQCTHVYTLGVLCMFFLHIYVFFRTLNVMIQVSLFLLFLVVSNILKNFSLAYRDMGEYIYI